MCFTARELVRRGFVSPDHEGYAEGEKINGRLFVGVRNTGNRTGRINRCDGVACGEMSGREVYSHFILCL